MSRNPRLRGGSSPPENTLVIGLVCTRHIWSEMCFSQQGMDSVPDHQVLSSISTRRGLGAVPSPFVTHSDGSLEPGPAGGGLQPLKINLFYQLPQAVLGAYWKKTSSAHSRRQAQVYCLQRVNSLDYPLIWLLNTLLTTCLWGTMETTATVVNFRTFLALLLWSRLLGTA